MVKYGGLEMSKEKVDGETEMEKIRDEFVWSKAKDVAFQAIKMAIANNAMASPNLQEQYHLAVDVSKTGIGGVLFQLEGIEAGTEATNSRVHQSAEQVIMFMSFRLCDAETRYSNSEHEALAVI